MVVGLNVINQSQPHREKQNGIGIVKEMMVSMLSVPVLFYADRLLPISSHLGIVFQGLQ